MEYFVIYVDGDGVPARMWGPYLYEQAEERMIAIIMEDYRGLSEEEQQTIGLDGFFDWPDTEEDELNGGIYIIKPERSH